jgi:hypothetical protein
VSPGLRFLEQRLLAFELDGSARAGGVAGAPLSLNFRLRLNDFEASRGYIKMFMCRVVCCVYVGGLQG